MLDTSDMDPELARYLNRNYWEQKQDVKTADSAPTTTPSAPAANVAEGKMSVGSAVKMQEVAQLPFKHARITRITAIGS